MALASLVVFLKSKSDYGTRFARGFLEKQKRYFARRHSLKTFEINQKRAKAVIRGGNKRILFLSLVDTRFVDFF